MSSATPQTSSPNFPEMVGTLGAQLRSPYRRMQRRLYAALEREFPDIRPAHSVVFRHINAAGSRLTDLAEHAEMTKQSMAYLVKHLTEHGYVEIGKHPDDGRAALVKLTAKGRRCVEAALALSAELERQAASRMGAGNVVQLRQLLVELDATWAD